MRRVTVVVLLALWIAMGMLASLHAEGMLIRPYIKGGIAVGLPSAEDLGYLGLHEEDLSFQKFVYGVGGQFLYGIIKTKEDVPLLSVGGDLAYQRFFGSKVKTEGGTQGSFSEHEYGESGINILGIAQYDFPNKMFFAQGGMGLYLLFWSWTYNYSGQYVQRDNAASGTEVGFGFMFSGGVNFPINEKMSIPIMVRTDMIFRYGMMMPVTVMTGLNIKL